VLRRQSQIEQLHHAAVREQQVRRLDVSMDQSMGVGVVEAYRRLTHEFTGISNGERPEGGKQPREVHPANVFHH